MSFGYHEGGYSFSVKSKQHQSGALLSLPYNTTRRSKIISLLNTFTIKNVRILDKDGVEKNDLETNSLVFLRFVYRRVLTDLRYFKFIGMMAC